jgi:hypothetical protein
MFLWKMHGQANNAAQCQHMKIKFRHSYMLEADSKYVSVIRILDTFSRIPTARGQKVAIKF